MKRWRNTILGTLVVLSGVGAAALTVLARRSGDWELTRMGAIASIVFAVLIVIFVVPPLAKSARAEAARLDLSFQVTGGGVVFVCIYTVVAFAAWNTGNNLLFLVFSVLFRAAFRRIDVEMNFVVEVVGVLPLVPIRIVAEHRHVFVHELFVAVQLALPPRFIVRTFRVEWFLCHTESV